MPKKTNKDILKKNLVEALRSSLGVIAAACKKVGCSRQTYYDFMKDDPEFASNVESIKEEAIDFAEGQLLKLMNNENVAAIIFYLKTKGKKRGYVERFENDFTSGGDKLSFNGFDFLKNVAEKTGNE